MASRPGPHRSQRGGTAELAESLTLGFLVLLDSLGPFERVAFFLGDVFGEPYPVMAETLGKSEPACRQLVSRARRKVRSANSGAPGTASASAELLAALMESVLAGDEATVLKLLDPDSTRPTGPSWSPERPSMAGSPRSGYFQAGGWWHSCET